MFFPYKDDNPRVLIPYITYFLIGINLFIFLFQFSMGMNDPEAEAIFIYTYGLIPSQFSVVTMFTSMFLHGGISHIMGNMWFLWVFGDNVEHRLGRVPYAIFYLVCGILATLCHWFFFQNSPVPLIGASGAISGVLGAYFLLYPYNRVKVLFIFVFITALELQAMYVLGFYLLLQVYQLLGTFGVSHQTSVALWAHIGGFITGLIVIALYNKLSGQPVWPRRIYSAFGRKRGPF